MARQNLRFAGRPATARRQSWHKSIIRDGMECDATPRPGRTYTRETWPPRGRGRGESLTSARRLAAKLRTVEVLRLRRAGCTWQEIARATGFRDASGPYRAVKRATERIDWDKQRYEEMQRAPGRRPLRKLSPAAK